MKTITKLLMAIAIIATCNAQEVAHRAKIIKITSQIQQTPKFEVGNIKEKKFDPRYWLEIEAEVEVETTDKSGFIPEITANWYAVVIDAAKKKPVRLTGKVVFKNIRTKDKKVFLSAYVEPDTLERLTGKARPSDNDIEGVALTIDGSGMVNKGKYAKDLEKATAKEKSRWWADWKNETLEGLIVAKSSTPFAPLWSDRYPSEKTKQ